MFNIIFFDELDSTNNYAKNNILKLNDHDVIHTKNQTHGRGRMLRGWMASSDSLTFSIVLKNEFYIKHFDTISLLSASAVYKTIKEYVDGPLSIKWPNDVYYGEKKISGILLESVSLGEDIEGIIIGIGINVNNIFCNTSNLIRVPTSLKEITNKNYEVSEILSKLLSNFDDLVNKYNLGDNEYYQIIKDNNYLKNKTAYASMSSIEGEVKILDILPNNKLLVEYQNERVELSSGEITFHKESK